MPLLKLIEFRYNHPGYSRSTYSVHTVKFIIVKWIHIIFHGSSTKKNFDRFFRCLWVYVLQTVCIYMYTSLYLVCGNNTQGFIQVCTWVIPPHYYKCSVSSIKLKAISVFNISLFLKCPTISSMKLTLCKLQILECTSYAPIVFFKMNILGSPVE